MQRIRVTAISLLAIIVLIQGCATTSSTAKLGRGKPSLDNLAQPAAWIHIDGNAGAYRNDADGQPLTPWFITAAASTRPTFRVDVHKPLLGKAVDFQCIIQSQDMSHKGTAIAYGLKANAGIFELGQDYNLLAPGEDFVMRKAATNNIITEAEPLVAGDYVIAATLTNRDNGKSTVAISQFTVGESSE